MKKPFKLFEKDGQQVLVSAITTHEEICVRYSVGFDEGTIDVNVGFKVNDAGEKKMIEAFESVTEQGALEMMDNIKSLTD